jgi:hypothetical protein
MSKSLPNKIYQNLSISQRLRAAWQAQARGDTEELKRLKSPNEAGEYLIDRVSAAMNDLHVMEMAAQIDLLSFFAYHLISLAKLDKGFDSMDEIGHFKRLESNICEAASVAEALDELAIQIGLSPEDFKANQTPEFPPLKKFLDSIAGKSSKDWVDKYQHEFLDFLGRRHPRIACFHPAKQES